MPRDPVDSLLPAAHRGLSTRDVDDVDDVEDVEDEPPTRRFRRSLVAGAALLVLVAALVLAMREPRPSRSVSAPADTDTSASDTGKAPTPDANTPVAQPQPPSADAVDTEKAPTPDASTPVAQPQPPSAEAVDLPPRVPRATARADAPRPVTPRDEPAAMPTAVAPRPRVHVEVQQTPSSNGVDYSVSVRRSDGAPVTDADVRLRGRMSDGAIVEARLEPGSEPGVYKSLLAFSPRGPRALTLRVAGAGSVLEMPVADPAPGGAPARP